MSQPIHQEITFNTNAQRIYDVLTNAVQFSAFTELPAEIDATTSGQFSCFDGMITGQTIEMIPNKRLVQAWRVANWEPGDYSIVKFQFEEMTDTETKLIFDHKGFPKEHRDHLEQGWHNKYWTPLKKYLTD